VDDFERLMDVQEHDLLAWVTGGAATPASVIGRPGIRRSAGDLTRAIQAAPRLNALRRRNRPVS